jgi:hypothetical protein
MIKKLSYFLILFVVAIYFSVKNEAFGGKTITANHYCTYLETIALQNDSLSDLKDYYAINISNETLTDILVYIDDDKPFLVKSQSRETNIMVKNRKRIYAKTADEKFMWGPIDLTNRTEDFYWRIVTPTK